MSRTRSEELFEKSKLHIPGGVNSPVRAFSSVKEEPFFVSRASGSRIYDVDDNKYIDYVASWGPMILGHAHPQVVEAVQKAAAAGTSFGAPTEAELQLAEMVSNIIPACEMLRLVNSGTEATMHALRLARAATGREKIIKLSGCYHGASDSLLVRAGSGVETLGLPDSPGVPAALAELTLTAEFNDIESIEKLFDLFPDDIACVILEPVMGNMGVVPPEEGFLAALRNLCNKYGTLLIFDEVMTGFRIARGGAIERYGVTPDLMTYGKVIGGGLPVGAYGGRRELMEQIAPAGPVYQAGTLSGNPLATAAGIATLELLGEEGVYETLEERSQRLANGLRKGAEEAGLALSFNRVGSMQSVFFTNQEVKDYTSAKSCNTDNFATYFSAMLRRGIALAPSQFEAAFVSLAHSEEDIDATINAAAEAFGEIARQE